MPRMENFTKIPETLMNMLQESVLHVIEPNPVLGQCNNNCRDVELLYASIKDSTCELAFNTDQFSSE